MNCHLFDLSYTLCPIYISYGQLQNNVGIGHLPEVSVAQWQSRVQCNCMVLSSGSVQECFFFGFLCNCFSCFLDCGGHSNITLQPLLSGGRIFKYYYHKLALLKEVIHRLSLGIVCIEELCTYEDLFFFFISTWVPYIVIALKIIQISIRCEILD